MSVKFEVRKEVLPFLNISFYLNRVRLVRNLSVRNNSAEDAGELILTIDADIPCILTFTCTIPAIPAGKEVLVPVDGLQLNPDFLRALTEAAPAVLRISLAEAGRPVAEERVILEVHPVDFFAGFERLPELIAAYITPNYPYIYDIKRKAVAFLEESGHHTAFEGYQAHDPERVLQMMSAVFAAIRTEAIVYSALAPGYEEAGQRLRLLPGIRNDRFANCIDISLLFAACLEAIGLNPVLVVVRGHAFVGCWLQDETFPEVVNDDKAAITKRLSKGISEIAVVEATSVCAGGQGGFRDALHTAEARLVEQEDFLLSVDVKRARRAGIRPLPLEKAGDAVQLSGTDTADAGTDTDGGSFEIGPIYQDDWLQQKTPLTRQKIWERKLLDLSLRNNLLNLRPTRNMLQLQSVDPAKLEDMLAEGKTFTIQPDASAPIQRKYNIFHAPLHHASPAAVTAGEELGQQRLLSYYHQQDLDHVLGFMHRNARLSVEESGSGTLFLAAGLLKWYHRQSPGQPRYAPLLLIPVELSRRSVNSRFTLRSREEEVMINITLIEFLRQEFELDLQAMEQLPADEKGVDVARVIGTMRRAVMELKGWDVEEQVFLGNFSFSKLILWKDITVHEEALRRNDMVRSLISGRLELPESAGGRLPDPEQVASDAVNLPIATDVSQMEAVLAAQQGQSFILHGPPGTGKSQTITNIIADALSRGKRVLFVAAKKAALDVVHKRLSRIGLEPFTLELHSNKSRKSDVLGQLARTLEYAGHTAPRQFREQAVRLDTLRETLNRYVELLHRRQPWGFSLYESIAELEAYRDKDTEAGAIPDAALAEMTGQTWLQWEDWLSEFRPLAARSPHPSVNPLSVLTLHAYTPEIRDRIAADADGLVGQLRLAQELSGRVGQMLHLDMPSERKDGWDRLVQVVSVLKSLPDMPAGLCMNLADRQLYALYEEWSGHVKACQAARDELLRTCSRHILDADIGSLAQEWNRAAQSWFVPRWFARRKIRKALAAYRLQPFTDDEEIVSLFSVFAALDTSREKLAREHFRPIPGMLGSLYRGEDTVVRDIDVQAALTQRAAQILSGSGAGTLQDWLRFQISQGRQYTGEMIRPAESRLREFLEAASDLELRISEFQAYTEFRLPYAETGWMEHTIRILQEVAANLPGLKDRVQYLLLKKQALAGGLGWFTEMYEAGGAPAQDPAAFFYYTAHRSFAGKIIGAHEALSLFSGESFEERIAHYRKVADAFRELSRQELVARLASQLPDPSVEAMQSSEIGILQRTIRSRGRGVSIRRLFDMIPNLLPRIAPCMLMSPLSAAQYFDADPGHFDLVIFDEASQLPTCESVSALARARQAIVVGDPKQMPPTSFFSSYKSDDADIEVEDLESILDDCLALSVPSRYLLRHYRSRHESLIAFSNVQYYDGRLLTFPSADDLERKVVYHPVEGYYDKGKSRTNRFEAVEIVRYIRAHYKDPGKSRLSLGVVTFSQAQQDMVEDQLQDLFRAEPETEALAMQGEEPLFIKNLENVQGDERDIILFSIGYGPDKEGRVSINFGPVNREGGWRRLNVAVTRSRHEMHVFASLRADQIDLSRTGSEGVAGLKAFLQYAESGRLAVSAAATGPAADNVKLATAVKERLQERGLQAVCQIGTSGFKLDLGVVHPEYPGRYILGIMLDGPYYHRARTTNDRERVMPSVLEGLGWNLFRIWTVDWYAHPERILDEIVRRAGILQHGGSLPEAEPEVETEADPGISVSSGPEPADGAQADEARQGLRIPYESYIPKATPKASSQTIYESRNRARLRQQLQMVVETEGPVSRSWLLRRILQAWNMSRAGSRLEQYLDELIREAGIRQTPGPAQVFYWNRTVTPEDIGHYRENDTVQRSMEDIAPEEIRVALLEAVRHNLSIEEEELVRYLARCFGYSKLGRQMEPVLRYTIDSAVLSGKVVRREGRIMIA